MVEVAGNWFKPSGHIGSSLQGETLVVKKFQHL
jgi:hypothetical protein